MRLCNLRGCGIKHHAKGMCHPHYKAFLTYGDPHYRKRYPLQFNGQSKSILQWAKEIGIDPASLSLRLRSGWTVERALTTPRGKFGPRAQAARQAHP